MMRTRTCAACQARMSVCNMSIEAGARPLPKLDLLNLEFFTEAFPAAEPRAGMVAPDEITFNYLKGRSGWMLCWHDVMH